MSKKDLGLLTAFAALGMMSGNFGYPQMTEESRANLNTIRIKQGLESQPKNKGLKEFTINGETVWALNYKNALRKIQKNK